jgi:hypothetical protein
MTLQQYANPTLTDVAGTAITNMSNATVLEGYSTAVYCFGAQAVLYEIFDAAVGTAVAPTAIVSSAKCLADSAWNEGDNACGTRSQPGVASNFWRNPRARFLIVPATNGGATFGVTVFEYDQMRVHISIAATANLFTPQFKVWVLRDDVLVGGVVT